MRFTPIVEIWKIYDILELTINGRLDTFPHQRPLKLRKNYVSTFIESVLNGDMDCPFKLGDIKSFTKTSNGVDKDFFDSYLNNGRLFSIEDCLHRISALRDVTPDHFVGEFKGREEEFLNSEICVYIYKNMTRLELIRKFGGTNGGRQINSDETTWGILNSFNNSIKSIFVDNENYLKLYRTKKKSDVVERTLYGNIVKILKVCSFYDGLITTNANTKGDNIRLFINSDLDITNFDSIIKIKDEWYDIIKNMDTMSKFTTQSNLYFILHISKKNNLELNKNRVLEIMESLSDTRSSAETRYRFILDLLKNEG